MHERYYKRYREILDHHSKHLLWGMDASWQWDFNAWMLDIWIDVWRAMLGPLSEENARNVGYQTAEQLFDIDIQTDE
jgi:hypothetical protein